MRGATGQNLTDREIASSYDALAGELSLGIDFYQAIIDFTGDITAQTILDVGCGNGELIQLIRHTFPGVSIVGVDVARRRLTTITQPINGRLGLVQNAASEGLPIRSEMIDLMFVSEVIEHVKRPCQFLKEVARVLHPTGRLILTTPNCDAYLGWQQWEWVAQHISAHRYVTHFLPYEHPLRTHQPIDSILSWDAVHRLLYETGFTPRRVRGYQALPAIFTLPGIQFLWKYQLISRPAIDAICHRMGLDRWCNHIFWDCTKGPSTTGSMML